MKKSSFSAIERGDVFFWGGGFLLKGEFPVVIATPTALILLSILHINGSLSIRFLDALGI